MTAHRVRIRGLRIHHGWYWQASCAVCGPHQAGARVWADLVEWAVWHYGARAAIEVNDEMNRRWDNAQDVNWGTG